MFVEQLLELRNVSKKYNDQVVLHNIHLSLKKGEVLAILGKNGSGKSTLTKIISGAVSADAGDIFVEGSPVNLVSPADAIKLGIRVIYQELQLFENLTVAENILFGHFPHAKSFIFDWTMLYERSKELCEKYGYPLNVKQKVKELGLGDRIFVAILRALSQNTKILVMDEPTSALTEAEIQLLFRAMRQIKNEGIPILFITHKVDDIYQIADRVMIVSDGKISQLQSWQASTRQDIIRSMAGDNMKERYPKLAVKKTEELLRVEGLGRPGAIQNISFDLRRGEIVGIAGLMGSGRTSLATTIFGASGGYTGSIWIKGQRVTIKNPRDAVKNGIAFVPEDRGLGIIPGMDVVSNTSIAHLKGFENEKIRWLLDKPYENRRVAAFLKKLAIKSFSYNQDVSQLSGGNQQKLMMARWLLPNSDIFLLDEPTKGIDVANKVELFNIMNELVRNGKGIVFISSDFSEIIGMCDRILVMHNGSIVKELNRLTATKEQILHYASDGYNPEGECSPPEKRDAPFL
ncbi:MAG: transporter related protein [Brevibacillus sp.]|nr:transporter related protein [Brevibacillus sp.]